MAGTQKLAPCRTVCERMLCRPFCGLHEQLLPVADDSEAQSNKHCGRCLAHCRTNTHKSSVVLVAKAIGSLRGDARCSCHVGPKTKDSSFRLPKDHDSPSFGHIASNNQVQMICTWHEQLMSLGELQSVPCIAYCCAPWLSAIVSA